MDEEDSLFLELIIVTLNQANDNSVDFSTIRLTEKFLLYSHLIF